MGNSSGQPMCKPLCQPMCQPMCDREGCYKDGCQNVEVVYQPAVNNPQTFTIATLNLLGNAYNPVEFMNSDPVFAEAYPKIRAAFSEITTTEVLKEAQDVGADRDKLSGMLLDEQFEKALTREFLDRDNKLALELRTNMIVAGTMLVDKVPAYTQAKNWRDLMKAQLKNYEKDPQLVAWDIACNLAVEKNYDAYAKLCEASCFNPMQTKKQLGTLLDKLVYQIAEHTVCAIQEFPEADSAKYRMVMEELDTRGIKAIQPGGGATSVGFLISPKVQVQSIQYCPLGKDLRKILETVGAPPLEELDPKDQGSLKTTALKSVVMDTGGGLRFVNAHCKEFKTEAGLEVLAKYLRGMADSPGAQGDADKRSKVVLVDANTQSAKMEKKLEEAMKSEGYIPLTPCGNFKTTRKQRSELHGQIYDKRKCLQVVQAHKTFAYLSADIENMQHHWEPGTLPQPIPDFRNDPRDLPNSDWPSDHCMLKGEIKKKATTN